MNKKIIKLLLEYDEYIIGALIHLFRLQPNYFFNKKHSIFLNSEANFYIKYGYLTRNKIDIIRNILIKYSDDLEKTKWNYRKLPVNKLNNIIKNNTLKIILSNQIIINHLSMQKKLEEKIKKDLTFDNPLYLNSIRFGYYFKGNEKIYGYLEKNDKFYISRGYIFPYLTEILNDLKIKYEIIDKRRYLKEIDFKFKGKLENYQLRILNNVLLKDFGVIHAPCGAGKTVLALNIIAERKQPTIIIVHTIELLEQWIKQINLFLNIKKNEIGIIGNGKKNIYPITVGMIQTLYKKEIKELEKLSKNFGHIIFDECHHIPCSSFLKVLNCFDSKYMLGLSATTYRRDKLDKLIFVALGGIVGTATNKDLIESNRRIKPKIIKRKTDFDYNYFTNLNKLSNKRKTLELIEKFKDNKTGKIIFNSEKIKEILGNNIEENKNEILEIRKFISKQRHFVLDKLIFDKKRNNLIVKDIIFEYNKNNNLIVLTDRQKHCNILYELLKEKGVEKIKIILGKTNKSDRKDIMNKINEKEIKILIATGKLAGEGLDIPHLNRLFIVTPISWRGRIEQYVGRILRVSKGKINAKVYDYIDIKIENFYNNYKSRKRVYNKF